MTTVTLEELVPRALAGDRAALEDLCRALQGPVYRLALRMLGRQADAEDATQEILVTVVTHLSQFRGESRLTTWVYRIASRHLLRAPTSSHEARAVPVEVVADVIDAGLSVTTPASAPAGEVAVLARDVQRTCAQAMLLALTRDERLALVLVEMLGASDAVAAEICEVPEATLRKRLSRARAKLAPVLEERCGVARRDEHCTCARQAAAKEHLGVRLPVYDDGDEALRRAVDELGEMGRLRGLLAVAPLPAPRRALWAAIVARWPSLLA